MLHFLVFLSLAALSSADYTEHDEACATLVTEFLISKSQEIQKTYENRKDSDPLGVINRIAKDSFEKCKTDIRNSQVRTVNEHGVSQELLKVVEINIKDYIGVKVEPSYDFVMSLKKMKVTKKEDKQDL